MAPFSRRGSSDEPTPEPADTAASAPSDAAPDLVVPPVPEAVPHVGISMSTFGSSAATARPIRAQRPAQTAPAASQTVGGMPDNVVLQAALKALPDTPQNTDIMNVMRQALQGSLYVRAQGDAKTLLAEGKGLSLAITTHNDKRFLLVYSGGGPMQVSALAEGASETSAVGQLAHNIFRTAIESGYDGVYIDHVSPGARVVLPIELIKKALEESEPTFALKTLLVSERGDATPLEAAEILARVKVWAAGGTDPSGRIGLAEARGGDGSRRLEVFSHPLEVIAMGRGDRPLPLTPEQLGKALASEPALTGIVLDAAGPWIEIDRDVLAPVIALAD